MPVVPQVAPHLKGGPLMANTVEITAPCPDCGNDATWYGRVVHPGGSTAYEIDCNRCDRPWSLTQQLARRLERICNAVIERTAA